MNENISLLFEVNSMRSKKLIWIDVSQYLEHLCCSNYAHCSNGQVEKNIASNFIIFQTSVTTNLLLAMNVNQ